MGSENQSRTNCIGGFRNSAIATKGQLKEHRSNHCIDGDYSECEDKKHGDDWETIEIQQGKGYGHHRATRGDIQEQREGIKDLVTKDALLLHQVIP